MTKYLTKVRKEGFVLAQSQRTQSHRGEEGMVAGVQSDLCISLRQEAESSEWWYLACQDPVCCSSETLEMSSLVIVNPVKVAVRINYYGFLRLISLLCCSEGIVGLKL